MGRPISRRFPGRHSAASGRTDRLAIPLPDRYCIRIRPIVDKIIGRSAKGDKWGVRPTRPCTRVQPGRSRGRLGANDLAVRRLSRRSSAEGSTTRRSGGVVPGPAPARRRDRAVAAADVLDRVLTSARDGFQKLRFLTHDGLAVETVLIPLQKPGAVSVCLSSQVGCAMGCVFCATARMSGRRNLATWEIVDQWVQARDLARTQGRRVTGVVFMGMGEPFLNYDRVHRGRRAALLPVRRPDRRQGDHDQHGRARPRDRPLTPPRGTSTGSRSASGRRPTRSGPGSSRSPRAGRWPRSWPPPAATPWPGATASCCPTSASRARTSARTTPCALGDADRRHPRPARPDRRDRPDRPVPAARRRGTAGVPRRPDAVTSASRSSAATPAAPTSRPPAARWPEKLDSVDVAPESLSPSDLASEVRFPHSPHRMRQRGPGPHNRKMAQHRLVYSDHYCVPFAPMRKRRRPRGEQGHEEMHRTAPGDHGDHHRDHDCSSRRSRRDPRTRPGHRQFRTAHAHPSCPHDRPHPEEILDQGTVVIKQPDIWSQARMTKFRKEFEDTMSPELEQLPDHLSAQMRGATRPRFPARRPSPRALAPLRERSSHRAPRIALPIGDPSTGKPIPFPVPAATSTTTAAGFSLLNAATVGDAPAPRPPGVRSPSASSRTFTSTRRRLPHPPPPPPPDEPRRRQRRLGRIRPLPHARARLDPARRQDQEGLRRHRQPQRAATTSAPGSSRTPTATWSSTTWSISSRRSSTS